MLTHPIIIAETHGFMRAAQKIWSEAELAALVDHFAHNPDDGEVILTPDEKKAVAGFAAIIKGSAGK